jgi:hypothetical protein
MSRHNRIRASLALIAAGLAFGATSAGAMPVRDAPPPSGPHAAHFYDAGHASLAIEQAQTNAAAQNDNAAQHVLAAEGVTPGADLRGEHAKDAAIIAQRHEALSSVHPTPAPPQFSTTKVTALHSTQPLPNDDGTDVSLAGIILGLFGAGLLGAGAAFAVSKTTRSRRARVVA